MSVITSQPAVSSRPALTRSLTPSRSADAPPSGQDASGAAGSPPLRPAALNGSLQQSLNQGWQDYMQKLRVDLNRPVKQQNRETDQLKKQMLKQRVDSLRQMMLMTHDKASLRALAGELARLARDLKELVTSMTRNAADTQVAVNVNAGNAAADPSSSQDVGQAAASSDGAQDAAADEPTPTGGAEAGQAAGAAGGAVQETPPGAAASAIRAPTGADARLGAMLTKGNPVANDPDIRDMQRTLKMIQAFIKQMAQLLKDQDKEKELQLREDMHAADKALQDVDKILKGGPEAMAAMGESGLGVSVAADGEAASGGVGQQAAE